MRDKIFNFLKENIGKNFYIGGVTIGFNREVLKKINIKDNILEINDICIDLTTYTYMTFLKEHIISLNNETGNEYTIIARI